MSIIQIDGIARRIDVVLNLHSNRPGMDQFRNHVLTRFQFQHGRVEVRMPDVPGNYALTFDDGEQVEKVFSVNPSPKESQLVYLNRPEAMKLWQLSRPAEDRKAARALQARVSLAGILQQQVWWWMVLGALLLLGLEMLLAETRRESA